MTRRNFFKTALAALGGSLLARKVGAASAPRPAPMLVLCPRTRLRFPYLRPIEQTNLVDGWVKTQEKTMPLPDTGDGIGFIVTPGLSHTTWPVSRS